MTEGEQQSEQRPFVKLSEVLTTLQEKDRHAFLRLYREGVRDGQVKAIPLRDTYMFEASKRRGEGQQRAERQDEAIQNNDAFQAWLEKTRVKLSGPKINSAIAVSFEELLSGQVKFDQRSAQYRKQLQTKAQRARQSKRGKADAPSAEA